MKWRALTTAAIFLASAFTSSDVRSAFQKPSDDVINVDVATLLLNDQDRSVLLVLKPHDSGPAAGSAAANVLPLVIGLEEARSIGVAFQKVPTRRPLSHDLMKTIIEQYGGSIVSCTITKMEQETFYAELRLKRDGRELTIDCRPSDAIALALRSSAPVLVRRSVMLMHGVDPSKPEKTEKPLKT
ncbi:MAG TPA: bifunctional nuclease family protein [Blastocatellia bacterium]|nr:bifunctional nuclease family protein [Blastocatellia bacterium]